MMADELRADEQEKEIFTDSHAKSILTTMNSLRRTGTLCDVTLRIDDKDFHAHRIVLAACSDYFCAMFTNEMLEKDMSVIDLHGVSADVMDTLLDFVYTETVHVNVDNVQELLAAANLLQLTGVKHACSEFLKKQLDPSNCLGIQMFADRHNCSELYKATQDYSYKKFEEVLLHDEFKKLGITDVKEYVSADEIHVSSEESVFGAVIKWVIHDETDRQRHLPDLLENVRLPLLSARYITDIIDENPLIKICHKCRDLVDEAKKYHLRPDIRMRLYGPRMKPRTGTDEKLVVIGGFGHQQNPIDVVEIFDPKSQEWNRLPSIRKRRRYVAAAAIKNKLYVIGGYDCQARLGTVECIDTSIEGATWQPVATLQYRRGLAGICTYKDQLYICGGFDGTTRHTSMECYDPIVDQWTLLGNMAVGREGAGLVEATDMIFCIGGYDGVNLLSSVERYDIQANQWSSVAPMSTRRSGAGVAVLNDTIYVCGGYDGSHHLASVECYNVRTGQWSAMTSMSVPRCYVGACILRGKLYVVAGYDGTSLLNSIEYYEVGDDHWKLIEATMSAQRCDAGVTVVKSS